MNWLGVISLILFLLTLTSTWWWMDCYLPNIGGYFKYNGNPITFVWSSGNRSSLSLSLDIFKWLSEEGRIPPGASYRIGISKFFLMLCTLFISLSLLFTIYAIFSKSSRAYFIAAAFAFLSFLFYEFSFLALEAPRSAFLTFQSDTGQNYVRWGEGIGKYLALLLTITLVASGFLNSYIYERPIPRRRPRRGRGYW
ncbi:hypothetical protein [Candidatus Korarchaeum cryptofilum]|uniref:Uncharacterized protein n=1 Tax=Korarchaeum cryptofilum (strain OPF8) TaxID=374847 RepID=B1L5J6_KORCO|nr:hypothetical protein [Candidatus Korarchaeum cryptofilum]ACB07725.1 hypothetical protein Kcr_0979 [Candidatus Korarchaeum cryptofilum OPF8]